MTAKQTAILASVALFTCLWVHPASAQDDSPTLATTESPRSSVNLTPAQLDGFAELTGDGKRAVAYRLSTNPRLVPLAAAAADARASRRSTGKIMTIVGFTILGVGDIAGTYIIMSTPGYPNVKSEDRGRVYLGLGVGVLSLGVGLALAIPGLIKMASPSEVEERALDAYSPGWRDVGFQSPPPQVLGKTVATPVWSFTF
jgi:hypothetical protein